MEKQESLFINGMTLKGDCPKIKTNVELNSEINQLNSEISELQKEIKALVEIRDSRQNELNQRLFQNRISPLKLNEPIMFRNAVEKAEFLLSFLSPRLDVFAVRKFNKNSKKNVGYYPVCNNRWKKTICPKNKVKGYRCDACEHRDMVPLTVDAVINGNFKNNDYEHYYGAIGIYPLKNGNKTRFVAIDLDSQSYLMDSHIILKTAREIGVAMLWERSSSGDGMHLWIFFSEDVPARDARALAFLIIDRAREQNENISIKSYDRLFPSQDEIKDKGIGNLILLPLVKSAAMKGNTLFLDDECNVYPLEDQVGYLSSIHRHTEAELETFLEIYKSSYLNDEFKLEKEDINPEWINRIPRVSSADIKGDLIVYLSSGISFDKNCLSKKAIEGLRRYAMVSNPEYYKRLNKNDGRIAQDIPSRIVLFEENERVLKLPRGLKNAVLNYFDRSGIKYKIEDHRVSSSINVTFNGTLYPIQERALEAMLKKDSGILNLATGGGKTVIALALIAKIKVRTLIIVYSSNLLYQWEDAASNLLTIDEEPEKKSRSRKVKNQAIGIIGDSQKRWTHIIDIATVQSLSKMLERGDYSFCDKYGIVIIDECHHIAAMSTRYVVSNINAKYVYGLSATLKRADGLQKVIFYECGGTLFSYDHASLARDRGLKQYYVTKTLNTRLPKEKERSSFFDILDHISEDKIRCQIIADDIELAYLNDRKIIVFTRRRKQNNAIGNLLEEKGIPYRIFDSEMNKDEVATSLSELKNMDLPDVIISTDKFFGEGIDIPNLDTLFLASPYMQEGTVSQEVGRIAREHQGKSNIIVYDYVDYEIPRLNYMFSVRLRQYRKLGFVPLESEIISNKRHVYDDLDYINDLLDDMLNAKKEIVISTTFVIPSANTQKIFAAFSQAVDRGASLSFRGEIKNVRDDLKIKIDELLEKLPVKITSVANTKNYIAIDREIVWYGELNMLSVSSNTQKKEERSFVLRIENRETATALIENDTSLI